MEAAGGWPMNLRVRGARRFFFSLSFFLLSLSRALKVSAASCLPYSCLFE